MKVSEFIKLIISLSLGLVIGILIGSTYPHWFNTTWKNEIGLDAFINVVTGVGIGVFLQQAYQKQTENIKVEKGILVEQFKDSIKYLRDIRNDFRTCYTSSTSPQTFDSSFITNFRLLSNSLYSSKDFLTALNYSDYVINCDEILSEITEYKLIITGANTYPTSTYTSAQYHSQERQYDKTNVMLHKLLINANRL